MKKLIAVAVLAAATPALAETRPAAAEGDRVRARIQNRDGSRSWLTGRVVETGAGSLTMQPEKGEAVVVPLERLDRFDRSLGRRGAGEGLLRGAGAGFVAGAVTGAVVGAASGGGEGEWFSSGESALAGGILLGASGAVLGAVVGLAAPGERWEKAQPGAVRVSVAPTLGGVGARVRFSF
jgi:hypothetical protein